MGDASGLAGLLALELFFVFGGAWYFRYGLKRGVIEKRVERHGRVYEGSQAMWLGIAAMSVGVAAWVTAFGLWYSWRHGLLQWH